MSVPYRAPKLLADVLDDRAGLRLAAPALKFDGADTSYAQLASDCERVAAQLWHGWGVRAGDRVAWLGANHPGQLVLLFALARIGAILLPLNFRLAPAELDRLIVECGPAHLVHDQSCSQAVGELAARNALALHAVAELGREGDWPAAPRIKDPDRAALLIFTSGTTSRPKAAVHTQANLLANMAIAATVQRITHEDVVATMLPLFHVGGLCIQTLPALSVGAAVILHPRFSADAAMACFEHDRPTLTLQVPATMKALLDHPRWPQSDLSSLRAVWAGSSLLPAALVAQFHARGLAVCNVYGATETGPFSIALAPEHARSHAGSCGWPAPGVQVRLAQPLAGVGELLVRGPNVIDRYWPDLAACDAHGWFHTGDLAMQADDGSYTIAGRARDLIISGGENIHPAEIESLLAEHPGVAGCAAFGVADEQWGEVVAAAVVAKPGTAPTEEELHAYLAGRLARFKLPRRWLWLDALPQTALGKVRRDALAQLAASNSEPADKHRPTS